MRGVLVALVVGAVFALSFSPADAKCGRRARGECGHRVHVHVVRVVREVQAPDATGTDMRAMASSQIEMAKKQLDMADAAVNRAKQEQDMASEAITRSKQEQKNAAQAMERSKREIEQMKARGRAGNRRCQGAGRPGDRRGQASGRTQDRRADHRGEQAAADRDRAAGLSDPEDRRREKDPGRGLGARARGGSEDQGRRREYGGRQRPPACGRRADARGAGRTPAARRSPARTLGCRDQVDKPDRQEAGIVSAAEVGDTTVMRALANFAAGPQGGYRNCACY